MTLVQRNGAAKGMQASSWLQQSVQQFFQDVNWDGRVLAPPPIEDDIGDMTSLFPADAPTVSSSFSFTMTVSNYFAAIPWDGVPMIAAPILTDTPTEAAAPEEKSVTLDDFFSSF
ncbi:MAG: hypothetical protein WBA43_16165 [Elainellaceae cyanobacterium]